MTWKATGILAAAPIAWLIACNSSPQPGAERAAASPPVQTAHAAPLAEAARAEPAQAPAPPDATTSREPPAPAAVTSPSPVEPALMDAAVRDIIVRKNLRVLCNDLNGCAMVDDLVALGPLAAPIIEQGYRASRGDAFWRYRLIEALGRIGAPTSLAFLVDVLKHDPDLPARIEAGLSLGRGRVHGALAELRGVISAEPTPPTGVILAVAYALATLGDPVGQALIEEHLVVPPEGSGEAPGSSPEEVIRRFEMRWDPLRPGVYAAGELRLKALRPRLEAIASRGDPFVRREAIRSLAKLRDREAVPALIAALGDAVPGNRREALAGLRRLTGMEHKVKAADWQRWWDAQPKASPKAETAVEAPD